MYPEFINNIINTKELYLIFISILETLQMIFIPGGLAIIFGGLLGLLLYILRSDQNYFDSNIKFIKSRNKIYNILDLIVNIGRSIPFIILMIALLPFTKFIIGKSIGTMASCVPLTIAAIPFMARIVENACITVNKGVIEAAISMGASVKQILFYVILPECKISIINGASLMLITLVGYSAMAGTLAGGGLGALAFNYGYQRFNNKIILITVILMLVLVQLLQYLNNYICKKYTVK